MYKQIVTLASISQLFNLAITDGQIVIIPKLVAVLVALAWGPSVKDITDHFLLNQ